MFKLALGFVQALSTAPVTPVESSVLATPQIEVLQTQEAVAGLCLPAPKLGFTREDRSLVGHFEGVVQVLERSLRKAPHDSGKHKATAVLRDSIYDDILARASASEAMKNYVIARLGCRFADPKKMLWTANAMMDHQRMTGDERYDVLKEAYPDLPVEYSRYFWSLERIVQVMFMTYLTYEDEMFLAGVSLEKFTAIMIEARTYQDGFVALSRLLSETVAPRI